MGAEYLIGDTRARTAELEAGSVALVATSPPFINLRTYLPADDPAKEFEMGSEPTPAAYLDALLEVTAEWGRVLTPWGSIAVELGDTYSGSGGHGGDYNQGGLREGQPQFAGSAAAARGARFDGAVGKTNGLGAAPRPARNRSAPKNDLPDAKYGAGRSWDHERAYRAGRTRNPGPDWPLAKSLALIPQLYAIALAYGINPLTGTLSPAGRWMVRNEIVWHRTNPTVGALSDKVRPSTSYITVATRDSSRWFDLTAVRRPGSPNTHARVARGVESRPQTGKNVDKDGGWATLDTINGVPGGPPLDAWFDEYDGTHDLWTMSSPGSSLAHYAMWPAKLAERLVLMLCPEQVCTTCGEPRRRIEKMDYQVNREGGTSGVRRDASDPDGHRGGMAGQPTMTAIPELLGWTDCGHGTWARGVVLDPFCGTGTTVAAADLSGRDGIGIDLDSRNAGLYKARYDEVKKALFGTPIPNPDQYSLFD